MDMEYNYPALLLHQADQDVREENVKAVLSAAGVAVNDARVKALVASLEGVDINEAIEKAAAAPVAVAAAPAAAGAAPAAAAAEEEPEKDEKEEEESGMAGLGALFG